MTRAPLVALCLSLVPTVAPAAPNTSGAPARRFADALLDQGVELSGIRLERGPSKEMKFLAGASATVRLEQSDSGLPEKLWLGLALQGSAGRAYRLEVDAWRVARSALAHTPPGRVLVTADSALGHARPALAWVGARIERRIAASLAAPPVAFAELRPFAWGEPAPALWLVGGPHPAWVFDANRIGLPHGHVQPAHRPGPRDPEIAPWWTGDRPEPEPPPPFVLPDVDLGLAWLDLRGPHQDGLFDQPCAAW